ncbi:MAG: trypsin-like peptidase domain-containing protein [Candidatus Dormibacteria bacterium]
MSFTVMNDNTTPPPDDNQTDPESPSPSPDPSTGGGPPPVDTGAAAGWAWNGHQWVPGSAAAPGWGQPWSHPSGGFGPAYGWSNDPWGAYPYGSPAGYPPAPGSPADYPPVAPPKSSRMAPVVVAVAIVIALVSGVTGAGIGLALRPSSTGVSTPGSSSSSTNPSSSNSSPLGGTTSGSSSVAASAIAAAIDPSVVDVVNTLAGGSGLAEGTGIIISSSGDILTNNHVIDGAQTVTVQIDGSGPQLAATVLGYDPVDDVALIKINDVSGLNLKVAPLGNSDNVTIGADVVAIGNAYGKGGTPAVVSGTVADLDQSITASDGDTSESLTGMIQMNADIVEGDSGGPLVSSTGKVIGMDTAGTETGASFSGQTAATQGFAIPIDTALQVAQQIETGQSSGSINVGGGPFIGVEVEDSTGVSGALVEGVQANTPAASAGLQVGSVITSLGTTQITSSGDLSSALESYHPGESVQLGWVDSSGQQHTSSITLASGPPR